MRQTLALARRELYGLLTQRWVLILVALVGMELLLGVGSRLSYLDSFDLSNVAVTMCFLGSLAVLGLSLDAVTKERTSGSLDLILTRSISRRQVIAGKLLAYLLISVPVSIVGVLAPTAAAAALGLRLELAALPLHLTLLGTTLFLALFVAIGVAISLFCRSLQSAFAVGGAVWVFLSPLFWQFVVLRGLQRHLNTDALAWLNTINPMGAYFSTIRYVEGFGISAPGPMGVSAPTPIAYAVLVLELAAVVAFAFVMFDRQEEPGYQA